MGHSISISKTTSANQLLNEYVVIITIYPYSLWNIVANAAELWLVRQILHLAKNFLATKAYLVTDFSSTYSTG